LEITGNILVGKPGALQTLYSVNETFDENEILNINLSATFILIEGESLRIQNSSFKDTDGASADDDFSDANKDFPYAITAGTDSVSSQGTSGGGADGGNPEASLVTSFTLSIES